MKVIPDGFVECDACLKVVSKDSAMWRDVCGWVCEECSEFKP